MPATLPLEAAAAAPSPTVTGTRGPARLAAAVTLRSAVIADAPAMHALIEAHAAEGHLLPRRLAEIERHAARFVVATRGHDLVGVAELAPLAGGVAEVRSLVVRDDARHAGVGRRIVAELTRRARVAGLDTLAAFTHGPGFFVRQGFSLVPHQWVPEKIQADCQACSLFRSCGQQAVVLSLTARGRAGRPLAS